MVKIGVYKITNPLGKIYVGSSKNIFRRWNYYKNLNCKKQIKLYNSFLKYGVENHKFEILEECIFEDLYKKEHLYSIKLNSLDKNLGLNLKILGYDDVKTVFSEETKQKMSKSQTGRRFTLKKPRVFSDEYRRNLSIATSKRKHSIETKAKISKANKGKIRSEEAKNKYRIAKLNTKLSKKTIEKIALKNKKLFLNVETGIYYLGCKEAYESLGVKYSFGTFKNYLKNNLINKIHLTYV